MRLLVLTAAYPCPREPERAVFIESFTRALASGAGAHGDGVESVPGGQPDGGIDIAGVIAPRVRSVDPPRELRRGIPVVRFPYPGGGLRLKELPRAAGPRTAAYLASALWRVLAEIRRTRPDALLAHWVLPMGPVAALAASVHGLPFCLWAHGSDLLRYASKGRTAGFLARASLRRAAAVLAVSRELEERILRDPRVARERVSRLAMGVDPEVFGPRAAAEPGREELRRRLQCDRATLLFVGDLIEEKGLLDLLDARSRLEDEGLDVALVAAGDGPLRSVVEERARVSPTHVRALGRVAQAELASWYRAADALVLPSRSEGTPVSILEALSVGCPVVASRVGGIPDLFEDGVGGFLVEPGDAGGLSRCLGTAIRSGTFAVERRKLEASPPDHSASSRARDFRSITARLLPEAVGGGAP